MKIKRLLVCFFILLYVWALYKNAEEVGSIFIGSLNNYLHMLLPVLFPYMVISRFLVSQDLLSPISLVLPLHKIFRVPYSVMPIFWLGNLCGYPIGAQLTGILYNENKISAQHASLLCSISGNVSPAFIVQVIGITLWGDFRFGIYLLVVQFLFSCFYGFYLSKRNHDTYFSECISISSPPEGMGTSFCRAITESAAGCVTLCAYIVFFSVLLALLPLSGFWAVIVPGIFEFTAGVTSAASYGGTLGLFFTGFSVGWGGLSILSQVSYSLGKNKVSLLPFLKMKIIQGVVLGSAAWIYGLCFPQLHNSSVTRSTLNISENIINTPYGYLFPAIIIFFAVMHYVTNFHNYSKKNADSSTL